MEILLYVMEIFLTFGLIATIFATNHGQVISESKVVIENEAGVLEQVKTILSDFSRLPLNNLGTLMSSTTNFLLATGVRIFSVVDPKIVSSNI